jgi:hypothetical protein
MLLTLVKIYNITLTYLGSRPSLKQIYHYKSELSPINCNDSLNVVEVELTHEDLSTRTTATGKRN